ncbi:hypothetical protein [Nostoc sp. ChiQUE01b]|uniref:FAD binding domain-containing protein n=1 Tax=Nostoc sp. ChiQUE01b TaxID=3075376 RepID=UPI002AD1E844|nr:hypothetical protein [Nostoc sp. ChiQUE01b]MDZ8261731.1 hypothetical protein [Nostoc sp. ChiQUE01b]
METELPHILTDKHGKRRDFSIPPGLIAPSVEQEMRSYANRVLVTPFQKLVAATKEPFVQAILDLGVPQMAFDRIVLVGDAAFIPRPHTAASTSKAAANAIAQINLGACIFFFLVKPWESNPSLSMARSAGKESNEVINEPESV